MADIREEIARRLRLLRDIGVGGAENAAMLGSGMVAEPFAGVGGLTAGAVELLRGRGTEAAGQAARETIEGVRERMTYEPKSDIGRRGAENIGAAIERAAAPVSTYAIEPVASVSPALAAGMVAASNVVGPKGRPRPQKPRFDPGSPQQLIPGVEPLSARQMMEEVQARRQQALEEASFTDPATSVTYRYSAEESAPAEGRWRAERQRIETPQEYRTWPGEAQPETVQQVVGGNVGSFDPFMIDASHADPSELTMMRRRGGHAPAERILESRAQLQGLVEDEAALNRLLAGEEKGLVNDVIEGLRARRAETTDPQEIAQLESEIYRSIRGKPLISGREVLTPARAEGEPLYEHPAIGALGREQRSTSPAIEQRFTALDEQRRVATQANREARELREFLEDLDVERNRPEPGRMARPPWMLQLEAANPGREGGTLLRGTGTDLPAGQAWWEERMGVGPGQMNRETVAQFLRDIRQEPGAFQYGVEPPKDIYDLEGMARHFGKQAGERIEVERGYGDTDESPKIKMEKEHGRGEVMYDRHGDPKMQTYDRGDKMYEPDTGDLVVDENGKPVLAEGGEPYVNEQGEYLYQKSRGGEQVRDERGRIVFEEVENPDYDPDAENVTTLRVPGKGDIQIQGQDEPSVSAMGAGKVGSLLYQTLLADAVRSGYKISSSGLTSDNALRLLSNTLSNYARMGENPRNVTGTGSGDAPRVTGYAEGPELWRAEAENAKKRIRDRGGNPERLRFTGSEFTIDGKPIAPDGIKTNLAELSPEFKRTKVGEKTLMRMALFDYLRGASPEEATKAASGWSKLGPIFTGVVAALGAEAMREQQQEQFD